MEPRGKLALAVHGNYGSPSLQAKARSSQEESVPSPRQGSRRSLAQSHQRPGTGGLGECSKQRLPGARFRACAPMIPRLVAGGVSSEPMSRQQVTNAVINSLKMLEVDTKHFSGLSMHRGGISAGLVAGVQDPLPPERPWVQLCGTQLHGPTQPTHPLRDIQRLRTLIWPRPSDTVAEIRG